MIPPSGPTLAAVTLAAALCASCAGGDPPMGPAADAGHLQERAGPFAVYTNERFDFSVSYPSPLLTPMWPPAGTEGRGFLALNEEAELRAYGRVLGPGQDLGTLRRRVAASYDTIAYAATLDSAFVLSGYRNDRIAYTKVVRRGGILLTLELEYDAARRALYDRVVERVAPSFPGDSP